MNNWQNISVNCWKCCFDTNLKDDGGLLPWLARTVSSPKRCRCSSLGVNGRLVDCTRRDCLASLTISALVFDIHLRCSFAVWLDMSCCFLVWPFQQYQVLVRVPSEFWLHQAAAKFRLSHWREKVHLKKNFTKHLLLLLCIRLHWMKHNSIDLRYNGIEWYTNRLLYTVRRVWHANTARKHYFGLNISTIFLFVT